MISLLGGKTAGMDSATADVHWKQAPESKVPVGEARGPHPSNFSSLDSVHISHHATLESLPSDLLSTVLVAVDQRLEESRSSIQNHQPAQQLAQQTGVQIAYEDTRQFEQQQHQKPLQQQQHQNPLQLQQQQQPLLRQQSRQDHLSNMFPGEATAAQPAHVHLVLPQSQHPNISAPPLLPGEAAQLVLLRPAEQPQCTLPPTKRSRSDSSTPLWSYKLRHEQPPKRMKKPNKREGAPKRPRSAYLHFLSDFRGKFHQANPHVKKVSEMAQYAGEAWRGLPEDRKARYQQLSAAEKAHYALAIKAFDAVNPRASRERGNKPRRRVSASLAAGQASVPDKGAAAHIDETIDIESL